MPVASQRRPPLHRNNEPLRRNEGLLRRNNERLRRLCRFRGFTAFRAVDRFTFELRRVLLAPAVTWSQPRSRRHNAGCGQRAGRSRRPEQQRYFSDRNPPRYSPTMCRTKQARADQ